MIESIFKNISYLYYPKGLCNIKEREKYLNSEEFKRLSFLLNTFNQIDSNTKSIKSLENEFAKNDIFKDFQNMTTFSFDRCLSYEFDILEDEETLIKICLNISVIIPYYVIYVLENKVKLNPYKWTTLPLRVRNKEAKEYKNFIDILSFKVEKILYLNKFPEELINKIIPDITFQDTTFGNFTFFNAFFQDDNKMI